MPAIVVGLVPVDVSSASDQAERAWQPRARLWMLVEDARPQTTERYPGPGATHGVAGSGAFRHNTRHPREDQRSPRESSPLERAPRGWWRAPAATT
jgi:hypothetical protein